MLELLGLVALSFPLYLWLFGFVSALLTGEAFAPSFSFWAHALGDWLRLLAGVMIAGPLVISLHEWCHGLAFRAFGHRPRYGFRWVYAYATADGAVLTRGQAIVTLLAPLGMLTLAGLILLPVLRTRGYMVLFLAANAAGAMGDLWLLRQLLRFPTHVRVVDREDRMEVYGRPSDRPPAFPSGGLVIRWLGISALIFFLLYPVIMFVVPPVLGWLGISHLTLGPEGMWRVLEYSRTGEGFLLSLGAMPVLVVSGLLGLGILVLKPARREPACGGESVHHQH